MIPDHEHISRLIIESFRAMDMEADSIRDGHPTGLNWYGGHARPELKKPQTEPEWSKRLAALLSDAGLSSKAEIQYPSTAMRRKKCDVVITLDSGERVWVELKAAWKSYWISKGGEGIYRSYLLHPLVNGLIDKSHTVPRDMEKLATLSSADAAASMIVLLGFDDESAPMEEDIAELVGLSGLERAPWKLAAFDSWIDSRREGESVKVWAWGRTMNQA